jgi:hypothetical protein
MQNKPNFLDAQMNVKSFHTVDYENKSNWTFGENKPNQTQFQTGHLFIDPMLPLYKVGSNPTIGCEFFVLRNKSAQQMSFRFRRLLSKSYRFGPIR